MKKTFLILCLCIVLIPMVYSVPSTITIQGILEDSSGNALSGLRSYRVKFFDAQSAGNQLGTDGTGSVLVSNSGRFAIEIAPPAAALAQSDLWYELGIDSAASPDGTVDNPADVFPDRVKITSVPFAMRADNAVQAENAQQWLSGSGAPNTALGKSGDEYYDTASGDIYKKNGSDWLLTGNPASTNQGSVFIHWGNTNAPTGTELIYSGIGFSAYGAHQDSFEPFVMHPLDEDPVSLLRSSNPQSVVYPMTTYVQTPEDNTLGIQSEKYIQGAVCYVNAPTMILWGTHTAPPGWENVYRGYAFGQHYLNSAGGGPILIDIENFDYSLPRTNSIISPFYTMTSWEVPSGNQRTRGYIKGILVKRSATMP